MAEIIITSSILILALILLQKLCWGKISRRLQYGLWLLVVIRLLIPAQFLTSSFSVMQVIDHAGEVVYDQWQLKHSSQQEDVVGKELLENIQGGRTSEDKVVTDTVGSGQVGEADLQTEAIKSGNNGQALVGVQDETGKAEVSERLNMGESESVIEAFGGLLLGIYIVGVLTIAGCLIACNLRFRKNLAAGRHLIGQEGRLNVYVADQLKSPCLCGVFAPAIYMTEAGLATQERKHHILLHEMTHYKHGDISGLWLEACASCCIGFTRWCG